MYTEDPGTEDPGTEDPGQPEKRQKVIPNSPSKRLHKLGTRPNQTDHKSVPGPNTDTSLSDGSKDQRLYNNGPGAVEHNQIISAFHKSVRGLDVDTALYYLARMLQFGQDLVFIAKKMVVIFEDVRLADNSLLTLAIAVYTVARPNSMPEAYILLAHYAIALSFTPKSTRISFAMKSVSTALQEGTEITSLPVPEKHRTFNRVVISLPEPALGETFFYRK